MCILFNVLHINTCTLSLYISIWIILWSSKVAGKSSNEWMLWENQLELEAAVKYGRFIQELDSGKKATPA